MYFEPSDIATGREALQEFLVPERIRVYAMIQNRIDDMMVLDSQYKDKPEACAALKDLFDWLQNIILQDVEELGKLLRLTYDLPPDQKKELSITKSPDKVGPN